MTGRLQQGDRVTTPRGDGVITSIHTDQRWAFRRTTPATYIIVRIDGHPYGLVLQPDQVQPLDKEHTMMSDTETETITAQTAEEPDPAPDPEPDTDEDGEGGEEELTQWP